MTQTPTTRTLTTIGIGERTPGRRTKSRRAPREFVPDQGASGSNRFTRKSTVLTIVMGVLLVYTVFPLIWLLINSTKTQGDLFSTFGLWFGPDFNLWGNVVDTLTYQNGIFLRWFANTVFYVLIGAGGATLLATLAGYGMAKYRFPGRRAVFAVILGAIAIPATALAVPTFLLFSQAGLTNTPWAVIIPSLISPFGFYLIWVYTIEAVPTELLEAARMDGAGEFRTFFTISVRLLTPGIVTVVLFTVVATWNNYFLPLIMLNDPQWFPLTVGLSSWNSQAVGIVAEPIYPLVLMGSLIATIPTVIAFLFLQRFWQSGLSAGSVK